uniref:Cation efflux protein cytoplasmic domain-containing protein n=1 Tax=Panagrolaimus sp. PS1159 TaxID=55785 RepID=A0AC35FCN1_9BILA
MPNDSGADDSGQDEALLLAGSVSNGSTSNSNPSANGSLEKKSSSPSLFRKDASQKRKISKFYEKQNSLLEKYEDDGKIAQEAQRSRLSSICRSESCKPDATVTTEEKVIDKTGNLKVRKIVTQPTSPRVTIVKDKSDDEESNSFKNMSSKKLALLTLVVNISLMLIKAVASYLSGSLSILSSLVDSAVDITSGLVIWLTARAIRKRDPYLYPRGRTRLEPLALVIVSVIMAVASVQMIIQSTNSIVSGDINPRVDIPTLAIMVATVIVKFGLYMACRMQKDNPSIAVLSQDHRNDCVSNTGALLCAYGAQHLWLYLDPIGAILVCLYIAFTWFQTGKEQLKILSGKTADPEFINRIIKLCLDHDAEIQFIDTVYVYHFGLHFLVEVHIVLDPEMSLKSSHDISESLQIKIEALPEVERAFVHCDYEFEHNPTDEHKVV